MLFQLSEELLKIMFLLASSTYFYNGAEQRPHNQRSKVKESSSRAKLSECLIKGTLLYTVLMGKFFKKRLVVTDMDERNINLLKPSGIYMYHNFSFCAHKVVTVCFE